VTNPHPNPVGLKHNIRIRRKQILAVSITSLVVRHYSQQNNNPQKEKIELERCGVFILYSRFTKQRGKKGKADQAPYTATGR